jgi:hypothetical protein
VTVDTPEGEDALYRVSGLTGDGPAELWFGLVGDVFVVGSDEQRALAMADEDTEAVSGAEGAAVMRLDAEGASGELLQRLGLDPQLEDLDELVGFVEANEDELRATLRLEWRR